MYKKVAPDNKVISPILFPSPTNSSGLRAYAWTKHSFGHCTLVFTVLFRLCFLSVSRTRTYALVPLGGAWGASGLTPQRHIWFRAYHEASFRIFAGRKYFLSTISCPPERSFQNAFLSSGQFSWYGFQHQVEGTLVSVLCGNTYVLDGFWGGHSLKHPQRGTYLWIWLIGVDCPYRVRYPLIRPLFTYSVPVVS